ncbi:glutaminase [Glutamicibacter sp. MNS18]|uniref:glutaminase n=1 Tax=Glutamicibacter sp. MNS18 TaxID=2989817 RepID=UPI0022361DC4|nr:glutaminase [Glutamicibacter sp. MNS18]MCW4466803.1 glutaminase [Glutamicibacter sp. MNS18]
MQTPIPDYLDELLDSLRGDTSGARAGYIPELANANPDLFAMAVTTATGSTYAAGDAQAEFSIQSISKPFAYAAAIMDRGLPTVLASIGVEPSGEAFNELSLEPGTNRPRNPMINAGAITAHGLLVGPDADPEARVDRALRLFSQLAGRQLRVDENVCVSELETADHNLAMAHMLRSYGILADDPHEVVTGYTRQCSILVTVTDLSMMAATLANGGVQPRTRERIMDPATARQVMSVMAVAGMYDGAGDWLTRVGIPAKSGVAGGLVGVLPDQVGIGAFSPRLDEHGNSQRAKRAFERLSSDMGMHLFAPSHGRLDVVGVQREGTREVFSLQGNVQFTAAAELLDLMAESTATGQVHVDISRVYSFTDVARRMTLEGLRRLRLDGRRVFLDDPLQALADPDLGDGTYPETP